MRPLKLPNDLRILRGTMPYEPPTVEYLVRWRVARKWKQRQVPDLALATTMLYEYAARAGEPGPYADIQVFDCRLAGSPQFPDLKLSKSRGGGRTCSGRYVILWGCRGKDTRRVLLDEETARAHHQHLWNLENRTRGFWISKVILVRLS